jgi:5'-3' exoribonuclease 2
VTGVQTCALPICSDEIGEGEHKMFQYIRDHNVKNDSVAIYGLDSDIMMLSLLHVEMTNGIKIVREAPEYMKKTGRMLLDIGRLYNRIDDIMYVKDYIFLCILLGNDFMPHNISLNIRRNGIDEIIKAYKQTNQRIIIEGKINWDSLYIYIKELSKKEEERIIEEYNERERMERESVRITKKEEIILNIPIIYREEEKYINPKCKGWEKRYYKELLKTDPTEENIKKICVNYLEGLEWVFKYYTEGNSEWRWRYEKNNSPLLKDIKKNIVKKEYFKEKRENAFIESIQLAYVLPIREKDLIPNEEIKKIMNENESLYANVKENKIVTAFCRYLWEGSPTLPTIKIETLEKWTSMIVCEKK